MPCSIPSWHCSLPKMETSKHDGVAKSPNPRDLPLGFQEVISSPAARERVFANASNMAVLSRFSIGNMSRQAFFRRSFLVGCTEHSTCASVATMRLNFGSPPIVQLECLKPRRHLWPKSNPSQPRSWRGKSTFPSIFVFETYPFSWNFDAFEKTAHAPLENTITY